MGAGSDDRWSTWLREQRFRGGERQARTEGDIDILRERVLDGAKIAPGDTVLDIGSGDGLIGFGAVDRVGDNGRVIFCDISDPLLGRAQQTARERGVIDRCEFIPARAETLAPFRPNSIDVITLRSVLVYISEKSQTFTAISEVLKPGGRFSLFEPIHQGIPETNDGQDAFLGYDTHRIAQSIPEDLTVLAEKIQSYRDEHGPDLQSAVDFDERDLFQFAEEAGFENIRLDYSAWSAVHWETEEWNAWLDSSYAPGVPTNREAIREALSVVEQQQFIKYVRPLVEGRTPTDDRGATAYLRGRLPQ